MTRLGACTCWRWSPSGSNYQPSDKEVSSRSCHTNEPSSDAQSDGWSDQHWIWSGDCVLPQYLLQPFEERHASTRTSRGQLKQIASKRTTAQYFTAASGTSWSKCKSDQLYNLAKVFQQVLLKHLVMQRLTARTRLLQAQLPHAVRTKNPLTSLSLSCCVSRIFQKMLSLSTLGGSWGHTMSSMSQWTQSGLCPEPSGSQPKLVSTSGQLQRTPRYHTARRCEKSGYLPCCFHTNNDQPWPTIILKIWRKWFYSLGLRFGSSVTHFRRKNCLIKSTSFLATSFSKNNHNQLTATCINLPFKAPSAKELFVGRISEICQPFLQFILGQRYEIVEGAKNVLGWHWLILAKRLTESAREAVDHGRPCSETMFRNCVSTCFNMFQHVSTCFNYAQETLLRKSTMLDQPWRRNSSTLCGKCSTSTHTTCCLDPPCSAHRKAPSLPGNFCGMLIIVW